MSAKSNRREFLQRSAMAAGAAAAAGTGGCIAINAQTGGHHSMTVNKHKHPHHHKKEIALKLSCQDSVMAGATLAEKFDNMEKWGFRGFEPHGKGLLERVKEINDALKGRNIKVSAVCAGYSGCLISDQKDQRELAMTTMKEMLTAVAEIGSVGMIIVPAFNHHPMLPHKDSRILLSGFKRWDEKSSEHVDCALAELGDHATKAGTSIILEPLNRQECYFMRTLADSASMCKDVENPGVGMMGDFWHMTWEETSDYGAFMTAGKYLKHVHIASRKTRSIPGEDGEADNYVQGFKALKKIGYSGYVSLECKCKGDRNVAIPAAAKLLREQWAQA